MFIYNVTTKLTWRIHDAWLKWMLEEHMPALVQTNCFTHFHLLKLHEEDDADGPTYVAQYFSKSKSLYNRYVELFAQKFRNETAEKWKDDCVYFRTFMEVVA